MKKDFNYNGLLYKMIANIDMWRVLIFKEKNRSRANYIYKRFHLMQKSSLYLFLVSLPITFALGIILDNPLFTFMILVTGMNLPLTMLAINTEQSYYQSLKEEERLEQERLKKVEQDQRRKQREQEEFDTYKRTQENRRQQENKRHTTGKSADNLAILYLEFLGLDGNCSDLLVIKKAYRSMMKKYHPDINKSDIATDVSKMLIEAYCYLEKKFSK